jgi:hypothetical protein
VENSSLRPTGAAFHHGQIFTGKGAAEKGGPFRIFRAEDVSSGASVPRPLFSCYPRCRRMRRRGRSRFLMSVRTAARNFDLLLAIATPWTSVPALVEAGIIPIVCGGNRASYSRRGLGDAYSSPAIQATGADRRRLVVSDQAGHVASTSAQTRTALPSSRLKSIFFSGLAKSESQSASPQFQGVFGRVTHAFGEIEGVRIS